MSSDTLPFLASLLLKLHAGEQLTPEEVHSLQHIASSGTPLSVQSQTSKNSETDRTETNSVLPAPPAPPATVSESPFIINAKHCLARKLDEKTVLSDAEGKKVYGVKQCSRNRAKGALLCPKCEEFYTAYKEKSKLKKKWEGFINEVPLDSLPVVGSKWFREAYPQGLPLASIGGSLVGPPMGEEVPADPAQETVLEENIPAGEVQWALLKLEGIQYIYNLKDGRTYLADCKKQGEEQILWDYYEGRYRNGKLDPYAPLEEE